MDAFWTVFLMVWIFVVPVVLAIANVRARRRLRVSVTEATELRAALTQAQAEAARFARYQGIVDAEQKARDVIADAERTAAIVQQQAQHSRDAADKTIGEARMQAADLLQQARHRAEAAAKVAVVDAEREATALRAKARELHEKAAEAATTAHQQAEAIVQAAHAQAQTIAGDAYQAMQQAKHLERTVEAMTNIIEGYGDKYLVPSYSVLDELADEVEYADAGRKLKAARAQLRDMIKAGTAATCDYAEATRRTTAIHFVLDAFNGKVDSILADVRHDNFGTLKQKLEDAFAIVNQNGEAFRNARINAAYYETRQAELRWAVAAHELKQKEREEQRAIKERIREEEQARREYERAMKEAEKEEATLKKAMAKAQDAIAEATDAQKAKFEAQLAELSLRLQIAEAKNQRALSMAQQTRAGHVYVISNVGSFGESIHKIGLTRRLEPQDRIDELGDASVPFEFDVHAMIYSDDAPALEKALHRHFVATQVNKVNARKEFFRASVDDIKRVVEGLGHTASWTLAARCQEYRESKVLEAKLAKDAAAAQAWAAQQVRAHDAAVDSAVAKEASE